MPIEYLARRRANMKDYLRYCLLLILLGSVAAAHSQAAPQKNQGQSQEAEPQAEPADPLGRSTPHGTVVGFMQSAQHGDYREAAEYLQLSKRQRAAKGERLAQQLQALMDDAFVGRVGTISNRPEGSPQPGVPDNHERIGTFKVDDSETNVELVRVADARSGEVWLFSSQVISAVPALSDQLDSDRIESKLPGVLGSRRLLHTPLWRVIVFLLLIPVSYGLAWGIVHLSRAAVRA